MESIAGHGRIGTVESDGGVDGFGGIGAIGAIALTVHDDDAAALSRFTIARDDRAGRLPQLAAALDASELLYLATCNRVEVVYRKASAVGIDEPDVARGLGFQFLSTLLGRDAAPGDTARAVRQYSGERAVEHLFRVAAGLESAQLGEREIQGQLRDALGQARAAGTSGVLLDYLVEEALRVARQVHLRTQLGAGRVSLAEIAVELLIERVRRTPSPVALVGVTAMTRRCAEILLREGLPVVVVNRTFAHAEALVAELTTAAKSGVADACRALSLEEFRRQPPQVEALLSATGASEAVLDRAALERLAARTASQEPPLVVDLSVPPDVDPESARAAQVPRIGMDEINGAALAQHQTRKTQAEAARQVIDEALRDLRRRLAERALAPVIRRINQRYRQTALEGVERLLARQGVALEGAAREAVDRWAETLARRFAHLPTLGLRGLAAGHGMSAVRSFLEACDESAFADLCEEAEQLEELSRTFGKDRSP